jgi:hypothetical protein
MADYALFAIASENALGLKKGEFRKIFDESREQSRKVVIESSPVGEAILYLMRDRLVWKGTALELALPAYLEGKNRWEVAHSMSIGSSE